MEGRNPKRFNEFAKGHVPLEGKKMTLSDVLNREILVTDYRVSPSKFSPAGCVTIQFQIDGETRIVFTGSTVLASQLENYKDEIPFFATIKKIERYFTFT